jgi:acyl dehydratase
MQAVARYFEDVRIGEELPVLQKHINLARMMAYGAATWDFIRIHYDADYVRQQGFDAPFVDGQMLGGYLAQHVQDWAGPDAFLRKLGFRNRVMVYPGDVLTFHGVVTGTQIDGNEALVECDLWVENQKGDRVVHPASAVVRFPRRADGQGTPR